MLRSAKKYGIPILAILLVVFLYVRLIAQDGVSIEQRGWRFFGDRYLASAEGASRYETIDLNELFRSRGPVRGTVTKRLVSAQTEEPSLYFPYTWSFQRVFVGDRELTPDRHGIYRLPAGERSTVDVTVHFLSERQQRWKSPGVLFGSYEEVLSYLETRTILGFLLFCMLFVILLLYSILYHRTIRESGYGLYTYLFVALLIVTMRVFGHDQGLFSMVPPDLLIRLDALSLHLLLPLTFLVSAKMQPGELDPRIHWAVQGYMLLTVVAVMNLGQAVLDYWVLVHIAVLLSMTVYMFYAFYSNYRKTKNTYAILGMLFHFLLALFFAADTAYHLHYLNTRYHLFYAILLLFVLELFLVVYHYRLDRLMPISNHATNHEAIFGRHIDDALANLSESIVICDPSLFVLEVLVAKEDRLFDTSLKGKELDRFLYGHHVERREYLRTLIDKILKVPGEEERKLLVDLLPVEWVNDRRTYHLTYSFLKDPDRILIRFRDETDRLKEGHRLEQERLQLTMVSSVIKNRSTFNSLVEDFRYYVGIELDSILGSKEVLARILIRILADLHTYVGLFEQFHLIHITRFLRSLETELYEIKQDDALDKQSFVEIMRFYKPLEHLERDLEILASYIGSESKEAKRIQVHPEDFKGFADHLRRDRQYNLYNHFVELAYPSLEDLLSPHITYFNEYIEKNGLAIEPIRYQGEHLLMNEKIYGPFVKSLNHVFRNAIEHGIESSEERIASGKPEKGRIRCHGREIGNSLYLIVEDDGRGIDRDQLREKLKSRGLLTEEEEGSIEDHLLLKKIFLEEMTTKDHIEVMSGRGLGLYAVKEQLLAIGGDIEVESIPGKRTRFTFKVPRN